MRRTTVSVALTVTALTLAACSSSSSGSSGSGLPTLGASPSTANATTSAPASSTPTTPTTPAAPTPGPSPWTALPTIPSGPNKGLHQGAVLASSVASTPREKEAVERYLAYWVYVMKARDQAKVRPAEVAQVASGPAQKNLTNGIARLAKRKARTVGWLSINVTRVVASPDDIFIWACIDNGSYDVDGRTGRRLEKTPVAAEAFAALRDVDGRLVVISAQSPRRDKVCQQRAGAA